MKNWKVLWAIIVALLVVVGLLIFSITESDTVVSSDPSPTASPDNIACTQDARQCSDGSWVGRTGPDCEFECLDSQ